LVGALAAKIAAPCAAFFCFFAHLRDKQKRQLTLSRPDPPTSARKAGFVLLTVSRAPSQPFGPWAK